MVSLLQGTGKLIATNITCDTVTKTCQYKINLITPKIVKIGTTFAFELLLYFYLGAKYEISYSRYQTI